MYWVQSLSQAIAFIESHLTDDIGIHEVSKHVYTSPSHFQFIFHAVTGITIGEYIRNRRLSLAGQDLLRKNGKLLDVAMRYQYDTQESFSKAFTRFHGVAPSRARQGQLRQYHPLKIKVTVQGGFDMSGKFLDEFYLFDWDAIEGEQGKTLSDAEKYKKIVAWAAGARQQNPTVFDELTAWILDDSEWSEEKLQENEQIMMYGVLARLREQNARLRACLKSLNPTALVNTPVFEALDRFDGELSGRVAEAPLHDVVARLFADFSVMRDRDVRRMIAGEKTGPTGTDSVEIFGYINCLKDSDAHVQWALFMPDMVKQQQKGFTVESFTYQTLPPMRFIGQEGDALENMEARAALFHTLDGLSAYRSGFDYDLLFMHHYGLGVDVGPWHGVWGRFLKAGTPVPDGFLSFDFVPDADQPGPPYRPQFAFATFSGSADALHRREGYDCDAMYDVTRNIILGQGIGIPYPDQYWTAEVFLNEFRNTGTAYLFSVELP